jgi:hypothetical protein
VAQGEPKAEALMAGVILSDNFASYTDGSLTGQGSWDMQAGTGATHPFNVTGGFIRSSDAAQQCGCDHPLTGFDEAGDFDLSFRARFNTGAGVNPNGLIFGFDPVLGTSGQCWEMRSNATDTDFHPFNWGGTLDAQNPTAITPQIHDEWFDVNINMAGGRMTWTRNGIIVLQGVAGAIAAIASPRLWLYTESNNDGTWDVDDIRVTQGTLTALGMTYTDTGPALRLSSTTVEHR